MKYNYSDYLNYLNDVEKKLRETKDRNNKLEILNQAIDSMDQLPMQLQRDISLKITLRGYSSTIASLRHKFLRNKMNILSEMLSESMAQGNNVAAEEINKQYLNTCKELKEADSVWKNALQNLLEG
ncbi:MAG: hypothetical protein K2X39_03670 [Silvanigrellaceae bacterium]|nr:hypothetical protein [Silvanigrellaceae bacterium]